MKNIFKTALGFVAGALVLVSCNNKENNPIEFSVDKSDITVGAEGGRESVIISSSTQWTAACDEPWVSVLTASGIGVKECEVAVDTTLIENVREAKIRIVNQEGETKYINVKQTGFGNIVSPESSEVNIKASASRGSRYFDFKVTSNVPFEAEIDDDAKSWLSAGKINYSQDMKKRPVTVTIRFSWEMNPNAEVRQAKIAFKPTDGSTLDAPSEFTVIQEAAPAITDDRRGDSLAVLILVEKLGINLQMDATENMRNWDFVTLWEKKTVPDGNLAMVGRIRSVDFTMLNIKEDIPAEISHLKYVEKLRFYGNSNRQLYEIELGDNLSNLKYLKDLTIVSYGIVSLPDSFTKLTQLEKLNIGSNNFRTFPSILNKYNFPNLKSLALGNERRKDYLDLSTIPSSSKSDYGMDITKYDLINLFNWSKLEELVLSLNLMEGEIPDMYDDCEAWWSGVDIAANDTLKTAKSVLLGQPKVLPNCRHLYLNLNYFTGNIPNWILYHPNLTFWDPYTLVFSQEGIDSNGKKSGFDNEPLNLEYYYEKYPLRRPKLEE